MLKKSKVSHKILNIDLSKCIVQLSKVYPRVAKVYGLDSKIWVCGDKYVMLWDMSYNQCRLF